jgi:aspartate/methionine/tyrosine aminotransferase
MDVLNRANALERVGRSIYHLEAGQPSTRAPALATKAVLAALEKEALGYTEALGLPMLRDKIARHYAEQYGMEISPNRIVVTTGSSAGFVLAFLALFEAGQTLAIANPGYPAYRNISRALGINAHLIDCREPEQFRLSARAIDAAKNINGVLVASPSNPCGTVIGALELERIARLCAERRIWLISDEIYHGITYGQKAQTMLSSAPDAIVINSFSKYFSMTGWRIGWVVVPDLLIPTFERLAQNFYISPPTVSQIAAIGALDAREELEGHVGVYTQNRSVLLDALQGAGVNSIAPADGAFYLYADISKFGLDSTEFTSRLLEERGIAATSGIDFDPSEGRNWVRFSYAGSTKDIERAAFLFREWCGTLRRHKLGG